MKVKMITGEVVEVNDSYGTRLIEQRAAKLIPAKKPEQKQVSDAENAKETNANAKVSKKG